MEPQISDNDFPTVGDWRYNFYSNCMFGLTTTARGMLTKEQLNASYKLFPNQRIINHEDLPISWPYLKEELRWYTRAEYNDNSIAEFASQWDAVRNPDGWWLSNYGYWLWGPPQRLRWVIDELNRDPGSRRAIAHINSSEHLDNRNKDIPCTMYFNFHVRHGLLCPTIRMRSQDAVWGLRNDLPFFWLVADVVAAATGYKLGTMHYSVDSLHVYERHFDKVKKMLRNRNGWIDSELDTKALVETILNDKLKVPTQARRAFSFGFGNQQVVDLPPTQGGLFTD